MVYPVVESFYGAAERAAADYPSLRLFTTQDVRTDAHNATDVPSIAPYVWAPSAPSTLSPPGANGSPILGRCLHVRKVLPEVLPEVLLVVLPENFWIQKVDF